VIKGKLLESKELVVQASNNTKAQFANSPTLSNEIMNAIMDALAAHPRIRTRGDAGHEQMITGAGAGDIEQVTLGVIHLPQIGVVTDRLNALLQWNYFVVAGHHYHATKASR
jgi:hypothetical protein